MRFASGPFFEAGRIFAHRSRRRKAMDYRSLPPNARGVSAHAPAARDPFAAMRREMDRMFDDFTRGVSAPPVGAAAFLSPAFLSPAAEVCETDAGVEFHFDLPGIDPKDVAVEIQDGVLTVAAERRLENDDPAGGKRTHLSERAYGKFVRRFELPFDVDPARIEGHFDNGVLRVFVPRPVEAERRAIKVAVKSG
jgi:HSP20 family protein